MGAELPAAELAALERLKVIQSRVEANTTDFPETEFALELLDIPDPDKSKITGLTHEDLGSIIAAMPTLYNPDGSINLSSICDMIEFQYQSGAKSVLFSGTTGEASFMSHEEQIIATQFAAQEAHKRGMKLVAGTGSNSTIEQILLTRAAFAAGADAALIQPPYNIKCTNEMLVRHFLLTLNEGPCIIYSIKGRTGMEIPLEVIREIKDHKNFIGVKECDNTEDNPRISPITNMHIPVYTGNDPDTTVDKARGAVGAISVVANFDPELMLGIMETEYISSTVIEKLLRIAGALFPKGVPNPGAAHSAAEMRRRAISEKYKGTLATFRDVVGPLQLLQQEWVRNEFARVGIDLDTFGLKNVLNTPDLIGLSYRIPQLENGTRFQADEEVLQQLEEITHYKRAIEKQKGNKEGTPDPFEGY